MYNLTILFNDSNKEMKIKDVESHIIENDFLHITFWHLDHWESYLIPCDIITLVHAY